jgi:hypothetical protein
MSDNQGRIIRVVCTCVCSFIWYVSFIPHNSIFPLSPSPPISMFLSSLPISLRTCALSLVISSRLMWSRIYSINIEVYLYRLLKYVYIIYMSHIQGVRNIYMEYKTYACSTRHIMQHMTYIHRVHGICMEYIPNT